MTGITSADVARIVDRCCTAQRAYPMLGEARRAAFAARARRRQEDAA